MGDSENRFEFHSVGKLKQEYYRPEEKPPQLHLLPNNVPERLRSLIPLAERWGISDDTLRSEAIQKASRQELDELQNAMARFDDELDLWLAGPEATGMHFSPEYLAFSSMRMAADGC